MGRQRGSRNPAAQLKSEDIRVALDQAVAANREELLEQAGAYPSIKYWLRVGSRVVDAKAVIQLAWNLAYPDDPIEATDFRGDKAHVAAPLRRLGFDVLQTFKE